MAVWMATPPATAADQIQCEWQGRAVADCAPGNGAPYGLSRYGVPRGREGRAAKCATTTTRRRRSVLMVPVPRAVAAGAVLHARPQPCAVCPRRASVMMDGWTPAECSLHTCTSNLGPLGARAPHQGSTRRRRAPGGCGCLLVCDKFPASGRRTAPGARQARAPPSNPGPPQLAPRSEPASLR